MEKKQIRKVYTTSDIIIIVCLLVPGLIFALALPSLRWLGILLLVTAAFTIPLCRTGYVIKSIKGIFRKKEFILPRECKDQIAAYMEGRSDSLDIEPFNKGGMLFVLYFNKDRSQQLGRLFDYEGCIFTPASKLSELSAKQVDELLKHQS